MHRAVVTAAVPVPTVPTLTGWAGLHVRLTAAPPLSEEVKVTEPVGTIEPVTAGVTVAVKVTCWLTAEGDGDAMTVVVVLVPATTCVVVPAPFVKLVSPEYAAVIV